MAEFDFIAPPRTKTITVAHEPVFNALTSLGVLNTVEDYSGLGEWVTEMARTLPPERLHANRLVLGPLHSAAIPHGRGWPSFAAYLDELAGADPVAMRDRIIDRMWEKHGEHAAFEIAVSDPVELLADRQAFLTQVENLYRAMDKLEYFERDLHDEAFDLLNDPPALKQVVVAHMQAMWETYLKPEWARVEPMLKESATAFQQVDYARMGLDAAFRDITGRPLPQEWQDVIDRADHITLTPSAHIGPYLKLWWFDEGEARVIFGARVPEGVQIASLSRSDLLVRISALADDTRLRILRLLGDAQELRAQEIMDRLDLSQSAASRHLRQLSATGFVRERREDGAKCYSLNRERVEDTCQALKQFLA